MALQQILLLCVALSVVTVFGHPQVWDIGFNPRITPTPAPPASSTEAAPVSPDTSSTTAAAPNVRVTTPSAAYYDCLSRCPSTSEYNPICGSDSLNYHNLGRLNCAARCGTAVTMVRAGTCVSLG